ncbi:MAG: hypothetical protein QM638_06785 [Nocardioides sp.]|uniref:MinD/ParA family ATP-binding protein n=1 Tax=Nocardioides sp. TaxID=35761 RepID=UPI0039E716DA
MTQEQAPGPTTGPATQPVEAYDARVLPPPVGPPIGDPLTDPMPSAAAPVAAPPPAAPPPVAPPPVARPTPVEPAAAAQASAGPAPARPAAAQPAAAQPAAAQHAPAQHAAADPAAAEPRRFMTATDFLERRADTIGHGPASWGWRGRVRRLSGGLIRPKMGKAELAYHQDRAMIQRDFDGPRTIAFVNPKGGAAKTTGVLAAGYTFGTVRGGGVIGWDNNETRGTLGIRGLRSSHRNTTRELLDDLGQFNDVFQSRIGDLGAFVRNQGDAHFDVLASDERPDVTGQIHADDFAAVHRLLERFYRILLIDTGNNMRAENWLAAAQQADLLVVTSTVREDTGYSGLWMLDALAESGFPDLKHRCVTVLSDPSPKVDARLAQDLCDVYEQRTRAVYRVPFDPILVDGSTIDYARLSPQSREAWLRACAGMASAL